MKNIMVFFKREQSFISFIILLSFNNLLLYFNVNVKLYCIMFFIFSVLCMCGCKLIVDDLVNKRKPKVYAVFFAAIVLMWSMIFNDFINN